MEKDRGVGLSWELWRRIEGWAGVGSYGEDRGVGWSWELWRRIEGWAGVGSYGEGYRDGLELGVMEKDIGMGWS